MRRWLQTDSGAKVHASCRNRFRICRCCPWGPSFATLWPWPTHFREALIPTAPDSPRAINGLPQISNQYRIDGEVVTNAGLQPSPLATMSALTRFRKSRSRPATSTRSMVPFPARCSTRSLNRVGTNQYHGTRVRTISRNDKLNADDAGNHLRNRVRRNDYGFNVGGPVWIPNLYNGKNKTFFSSTGSSTGLPVSLDRFHASNGSHRRVSCRRLQRSHRGIRQYKLEDQRPRLYGSVGQGNSPRNHLRSEYHTVRRLVIRRSRRLRRRRLVCDLARPIPRKQDPLTQIDKVSATILSNMFRFPSGPCDR